MFILFEILLYLIIVNSLDKYSIKLNSREVSFHCPNQDKSYFSINNFKTHSEINNSFFHVKTFDNSSFGTYTCKEKNETISTLFLLDYKQNYLIKNVTSVFLNSKITIVCLFNNNFHNYNIELGKDLILHCHCGCIENIVEINWFKEGLELNNFRYSEFLNNELNTSLILKNIKITDSGEYGCSVNFSTSRITFFYRVNVLGFQNPTNQDLTIGKNAIFDCIFNSILNIDATFMKITKSENIILNYTQASKEDYSFLYLNLFNVSESHGGTYRCVIKDKNGNVLEKNYSLNIIKEIDNSFKWTTILSFFFNFLLLFILVIIISFFKNYFRSRIKFIPLKSFKKPNISFENLIELKTNPNNLISLESTKISYEINRKNLIIEDSDLGFGKFGVVKKATLKSTLNRNEKVTVAVKMLKQNYSKSEFNKLIEELETMIIIGFHENIIELIGCCTNNEPLLIVYNYACNGNLKSYLNNLTNTPQNLYILLKYAYQITNGMEYISTKGCLHRDLAARNVLVFENNNIKISDFGLAKFVKNDYFVLEENELIPIKWLPFESLNDRIFSSKSDVYMFGVLLWEMYTFGKTPFENIKYCDILIEYLKNGNRLDKPIDCPSEIYNLILNCCNFEPNERPTFVNCKFFFKKMLQDI